MWRRLQEAMGEGDMDFRLMALDHAVIPVHKPCIAHELSENWVVHILGHAQTSKHLLIGTTPVITY